MTSLIQHWRRAALVLYLSFAPPSSGAIQLLSGSAVIDSFDSNPSIGSGASWRTTSSMESRNRRENLTISGINRAREIDQLGDQNLNPRSATVTESNGEVRPAGNFIGLTDFVNSYQASDFTREFISTTSGDGGTVSNNPYARYNSRLGRIQTKPRLSIATSFMATFVNADSTAATAMTFAYEQFFDEMNEPGEEERLPGLNVHWSLTGQTESWFHLPDLAGLRTGIQQATIFFPAGQVLAPNQNFYLMWVDDNARQGRTDKGQFIDNFTANLGETLINPVPEPSALLLGLSTLTLAFRRRRSGPQALLAADPGSNSY